MSDDTRRPHLDPAQQVPPLTIRDGTWNANRAVELLDHEAIRRIARESAATSLSEITASASPTISMPNLELIGAAYERGMTKGLTDIAEVLKTAVVQSHVQNRDRWWLVIVAGVFAIIGALIGRAW